MTGYRTTIPAGVTVRFAGQPETVGLEAGYGVAGDVLNSVHTCRSPNPGDPSQSEVADFHEAAGDIRGVFAVPIDNLGVVAALTE
ncbi:MAG: hypothetical protein IH602_00985 [Bryobacteraceae bacterium]|nr:hypothetical protein [Bryobacteraceae bacterium]